jgi:hypothetical protein
VKCFLYQQRSLHFPKTPAAKKAHQAELKELKAIADRIDVSRREEAFTRLETASDFHDAILLLFRGVDLGFEPVAGALSGFTRPASVFTIKRVSNAPGKADVKRGKGWLVKVSDTPAAIAKAAREIIADKDWHSEIVLDLSAVQAGDRTTTLEAAFTGLCRLLSVRAGRLLSRTDIADAVAWLALAATGKADVQVGYGSSGWGAFLKRQGDRQDLERCAPDDYRLTVSVKCHVKPSAEHLTRMILAGRAVINAAECSRRFPAFAGVSPSGALLLPNHGLAGVARLDGAGLTDEALWRAMRLLSRAMYRATGLPLETALQPSWTQQRAFHRSFGVTCTTPTRDGRNHALHGAIQMANELKCQQPQLATIAAGQDLSALDFADHGVALELSCETERIGETVEFILMCWMKITAVSFTAAGKSVT